MKGAATTCAVVFLCGVGACSFILPSPEIEPLVAGNGGSGAGGGGGQGGSGAGDCVTACTDEDESCEVPSELRFFDTSDPFNPPDPFGLGDGVFPVGLARGGADVFAAMRYKPYVTGGPDLPVEASDGVALYRLTGSPEFLAKIHLCSPPNGSPYFGGLAASETSLFSVYAATGGADLAVATSVTPSSTCTEGATTVLLPQIETQGPFVPYVFRHGTEQVLDSLSTLVNDPGGNAVILDVAASADGSALGVIGVTPQDLAIFTEQQSTLSLAYFTARLDASLTILWAGFLPHAATGVFPDQVDQTAGIAVDDSGAVWTTGTGLVSGQPRMFVDRRSSDGTTNHYWVAQQPSSGETIAVRDGHVLVGANFEGSFDTPSGLLQATDRDFVVLHFDAASFDANADPTWSYPRADVAPQHDLAQDDAVRKLVIDSSSGCDPAAYVLSCGGADCEVDEQLSALLFRLDLDSGEVRSTRTLAADVGTLLASELVLDSTGVWVGARLTGSAYGRNSPAYPAPSTALSPAALFLKLPL